MSYVSGHRFAVEASQAERATFIRRTYGHVAGAILAFAAVEMVLLNIPGIDRVVFGMAGSPVAWLVVMVAFIGVGYLAQAWARSPVSRGLQYAGLALYVLAQAVIFLPLLYMATYLMGDEGRNLIPTAGVMTLAMFGGLTVAVFATGKDFSYLAPILSIGSFLALGLIVAFIFLGGATFGLLISFFVVALVSGCILVQTSNVLYHYHTDQYVAAALGLFSSITTLFYYILLILMETSGRNR
jgi:FtsH-binding integral membrane protein